YGGPVIQNVEVHTIFYGNANYQTELKAFYTAAVKSPWISWLSEYNTASPAQTIGLGTFGGSYTQSTNLKAILDDTEIQTFLKGLADGGTITPTANTFYAVHFQPGVTITMGGSTSCVQFCAYHGTISYKSGYIFYSVVPDQGGNCAGGCGSNSILLNNLCSVSSHELAEAITDAGVGLATTNAYPLAWYDNTYGEIGDICNGQQGTFVGGDGVTYTVQKEWSNQKGACIVSKTTTTTSSTSKTSSTTSKTSTTCNRRRC
ncbi:hypothetical protein HDU76_004299, partial [Blyttiomyces sp. JEL0837]